MSRKLKPDSRQNALPGSIRDSTDLNASGGAASSPGRIRGRLLRWYARNQRAMPWRGHPDPYAVWVSEIMLQQTRVDAVVPYFERFMGRFPSVLELAGADLQAVLRLWQGLGYYTRARNLHRAAQRCCDRHDGAVPRTVVELRALPGVGAYTAAAVASICFKVREPVIDGNVLRVAARFLRITEEIRRPSALRRVEAWLRSLIASCPEPGDFNQAMMELGALVCTPKAPRCDVCPLSADCRALRDGNPQSFPVQVAPRSIPSRGAAGVILWRRNRLLFVRRVGARFLGDLWELPGGFHSPEESPSLVLGRIIPEQTGLAIGPLAFRGVVRQVYSHFRLELHVYEAEGVAGRLPRSSSDRLRWVSPSGIGALPLSNAPRAALRLSERGAIPEQEAIR